MSRRTGRMAAALVFIGVVVAILMSLNSNDTTSEHASAIVVSLTEVVGTEQQAMRLEGDDNVYLCGATNGACKGVDPGDQVSFTFSKVDGKLFVLELKTEIE